MKIAKKMLGWKKLAVRSGRSESARRLRRVGERTFEALEPRYAMHGEPIAWDNAAALTLSFAPDGTRVGSHLSTLDATFTTVESTAAWQAAVARAFQTWAQYAQVNVGVVDDSGLPLGTRGVSHGDNRFGDLRVAGTPMSAETLAAAIDQTRLTSGTWTGDVLFNTAGDWTSPNDIFSAALHEAGHVLGLSHSTETNSPMFTHGVSGNLTPTANDIAALQALYGPRVPDENERTQNNDSISKATHIRFAETTDGFDGTLPLVQFGDLHALSDSDYFQLPVLAGYTDSLTFEVHTAGMSLLAPRITLFNQSGTQVAQATFNGVMGGTVSATMLGPYSERVYARVDSAAGNEYAVGGYSLVVKYDSRNTVADSQITQAVREGFRWRGLTDDTFANVDVRPFLQGNESVHLDEDGGVDDNAGNARRLKAVVDSTALRKYQYVGSISNGTDADHYVLRAPSFAQGVQRGLTISVESLEVDGVIGSVEVVDTHGNPVAAEIISNGSGLIVARVDGVESNKDYTVAIRTSSTNTGPATGNYAFTARFDDVPVQRETFLTATVSPSEPLQGFQLYVARTQLFNFAMESTPAPGSQGASVWVAIYNSENRPVFLAASTAGTTRSAPSVLLDPGEYYVQVSARMPDGITPAGASLTLVGEQASDPVGPPVVDPDVPPIYQCETGPMPYCYPGGVVGIIPYDFVPGPPIPLNDPPPDVTNYQVLDPGDAWFWHNFHAGTNELLPVDVSGDGSVAPLDALMVINQLNEFGAGPMPPMPIQSPFFDVTADLIIAPLDALMVINQLNGVPAAAAEGEAIPAETYASLLPNAVDSPEIDLNLVDQVMGEQPAAVASTSTFGESATPHSRTTAWANRSVANRSVATRPAAVDAALLSAPVGLWLAEDRRLHIASQIGDLLFGGSHFGGRTMDFERDLERG